jgi:hypothetical protein
MSNDNVINFKAGQKIMPIPYVDPQIEPSAVKEADSVLIDALKNALEMAEAGELTGIAMISWNQKSGGFMRWTGLPAREPDPVHTAIKFLGGLFLIEDDLKFWARASYPTIAEVINDIENEPV